MSKKPASQVQITFSGTSEIEWENGNGFLKVVTGHCVFPSGIWPHQILGEKNWPNPRVEVSKSFIKEKNFSVFRNIGDLGTSRDLTTNPLCKKTHKVPEELLKQNGCVENIQENTPIDAVASKERS